MAKMSIKKRGSPHSIFEHFCGLLQKPGQESETAWGLGGLGCEAFGGARKGGAGFALEERFA
jgi:hypothetical protein